MNNSQVIDLMMARLGGRVSTSLRAMVVMELNAKIEELETGPIKPWFMEQLVEGNLVAGQGYIDLPTGFLEEVDDGVMRVQLTDAPDWEELEKADYDAMKRAYEEWSPASPTTYSLFGDRFYIGPTPLLALPYRFEAYIRTSPVVDNNSVVTNRWLKDFFNYTTLATLDVVARLHVQSTEITERIQGPLKTAFDGFWRAVESRKHSNRDYEQE